MRCRVGALRTVGLVAMSEGLRDDAIATVRFLREQGTALKVISGDATATVRAIADACGVPDAERARSGAELPGDAAALDAVLADAGPVDAVWHLGDVVGYGPDPDGVVERLAGLRS